MAYELESFILDALVARDQKCLGGEVEDLLRNKESTDMLAALCACRQRELDDLDEQTLSDEFAEFAAAAASLRKVHRHILTTSCTTFKLRSKKTKLCIEQFSPKK